VSLADRVVEREGAMQAVTQYRAHGEVVACGRARVAAAIAEGHVDRQTAVITPVALVKPQNLRVLAAYVVPVTGHYLIGVMPGFPPSHLGPGVQWSHRQRAVGARIPPSGRDVVTNLLLVLKPATMTGSAQGVQVSYEVSGQEYIWQTSTAVTVKVTTSC